MTLRLIALSLASIAALGQQNQVPFDALVRKLNLSETQLRKLEQRSQQQAPVQPRNVEPTSASRRLPNNMGIGTEESPSSRSILTPSQDAELTRLARVLERGQAAREAIQLGLIGDSQWPGGNQCFNPDPQYEALDLGLTLGQVIQLDRLNSSIRPASQDNDTKVFQTQRRILELVRSEKPDADAILQTGKQLEALREHAQIEFRQPLLAVLSDLQQTRLMAFENDLQLASDAVALGLLQAPGGEVFCQ